RFMPEAAEQRLADSLEHRQVLVHDNQVSFDGTMEVVMGLDIADALDFEAAVAAGADALKEQGSPDPLEVRRAVAVGEMARDHLQRLRTPGPDHTSTPRRQLVLYVHLTDQALTGGWGVARVDNTRTITTADQVRAWCRAPGTTVAVKPVIDLNDAVRVDQYEVPDRIAERVTLRDGACAFPWCTRPARGCDTDHVVPYARGGPTSTDNLAALCRGHHRLKTHTGWTYTMIEPGIYLWTSPHGYTYLRDHTGTTDLSRDPP
ncbi:MAG: HNH endonuclease signature motif containing protein, partial [Nocardioides sp.]